MSKIKELFGVEIGEEFEIKEEAFSSRGNWKYCYFNEEGQLKIPAVICEISQRVMGALLIDKAEIIKYKKPILDDVEKKFIGNIIRPFDIKDITKVRCKYNDKVFIMIRLTNSEEIPLPFFSSKSKMYKGMETGKPYTPKQLGFERGD